MCFVGGFGYTGAAFYLDAYTRAKNVYVTFGLRKRSLSVTYIQTGRRPTFVAWQKLSVSETRKADPEKRLRPA